MSKISFVYDGIHSLYVNTTKIAENLVLAPEAIDSKNIADWSLLQGHVTIESQEIAVFDSDDVLTTTDIGKIVFVDQQSVGDILLRVLVEALDVPGNPDNNWCVDVYTLHHDETNEYNKILQFATGKYGLSQYSLIITSLAGKTIQYIYPYFKMSNRKGHAKLRFVEMIDTTKATLSKIGEAYSRPECLFEPAVLSGPASQLKLNMVPIYYGDLGKIEQQDSPAHSIEVLKQYPFIVVNNPSGFSAKEFYVTDSIKTTVRIFGYSSLGGNPLPDIATVKAEIDSIAAQGWYGVFFDQAGFDGAPLQTRARQNEAIDYAHGKGLTVFANCWNPEDIMDATVCANNPDGTSSHMVAGDWLLIESFLMSGSGYIGSSSISYFLQKYVKYKTYQESVGIKVCCLTYKRDAVTWAQSADDIKLSYLLALVYGFTGWWFSDTSAEPEPFLHGSDPDFNVGKNLSTKFSQIGPYWFLTETDAYIFVFSTENYPPLTFTVYDKSRRCELPEDTTILYSNDLETWKEYDPKVPDLIGKFVREKKVIV